MVGSLFYPERTGEFRLVLSFFGLFKLENVQPVCHMHYHKVLAMVLEGICPARWVGVAAGVPNEGNRKTGWKMAGILDRAA